MPVPALSSPEAHLAVRLALSLPDRKSVHDVRVAVFHHEQRFSLDDEVDSFDPQAAHFLLYAQQDPARAIGTLRLVPYPPPRERSPVPSDHLPAAAATNQTLGPAQAEDDLTTHFRRVFASAPPAAAAAAAGGGSGGRGAKLGRLAIDQRERRNGLGKFLVQSAEAWLCSTLAPGNEGKVCVVQLGAQMPVQGFYTKLGYRAEGEPFDDAGQPHILMAKTFVLRGT